MTMAVKPPPLSHLSDSTLDSPGSLSPSPVGHSPSPSPSLLDSAFTPSLRMTSEGGGTGPPSPRGFGGGTPLPTAALSPRDLHPIKFFLTQSDAATCDDRDRARPSSRHATATRHSRHRTTSQDSSPMLPADERADVTRGSSTPTNPILRELERLEGDEGSLGQSKSDGGMFLHERRRSNPILRELERLEIGDKEDPLGRSKSDEGISSHERRPSNPILRELESLERMNRSSSVDNAHRLKTLERRVTNPILRDLQRYDVSNDVKDSPGLATAGLSPGSRLDFQDFEKRVQPKQDRQRALHRHFSLQEERADEAASSDDEEGDVIEDKHDAELGSESGGDGGSSSSHVARRYQGEDVHALPGLEGKLQQKLHSRRSLKKKGTKPAAPHSKSPPTGGAVAGKGGGFLGQCSPLRGGVPKAHPKGRDIFGLHWRGRKEEGRAGADATSNGAPAADEGMFSFPTEGQPVALGPFPPPLAQEQEEPAEKAPELRKQETVPIQRPQRRRATHGAMRHSMDGSVGETDVPMSMRTPTPMPAPVVWRVVPGGSAGKDVVGGHDDMHSSGNESVPPQVIGARARAPGRVLPSVSQILQSPRHSFDTKEDKSMRTPKFGAAKGGDSAGGAPLAAGRTGSGTGKGTGSGTSSASTNVRGNGKTRLVKQDSFGAVLLQRLDVLHARSLLRRHNSAAAGGAFRGVQASESCLRPEAALYRNMEGEEGFRTPPRERIRRIGLSTLNKVEAAECQG